jgi:succinoglycan biosynthesis protein ExoA
MMNDNHHRVSIILPTFQEEDFIFDCLTSLKNQDYPFIDEILVVDGRSTDATREIAQHFGHGVRVVDNPGRTAAAAMNVGIDAARNEVIVRVDAHTLYERDYVSASVRALTSTGATMVGGRMVPIGTTRFGRAVAAVTSSPFGVGPGRFHYADKAQEVETVYLGCFRKSDIRAVGGYDQTNLQWAAEDQELNFRLRKAGGKIWLDPTIRSVYFPRQTPRALWRQYHNYGLCKASTLKKHRQLPYLRPMIPALMVIGSVAWIPLVLFLRAWWLIPAPLLVYACGATVVARRLSHGDPGVSWRNAISALAICHWSYGLGINRGFGRILFHRPFETRPVRRV